MGRKVDEIKGQKNKPRALLRVVDIDKDPELPVEERIDLEKTAQAHKYVKEKGSPLMQSILSRVGLVLPTKAEVEAISLARARGFPVCANCRFFDYDKAQHGLYQDRGVEYLIDAIGPKAVEQMGDWRKYGHCEAYDSLMIGVYPALKCPRYEELKKTAFGKIVGGVWRRLRDI